MEFIEGSNKENIKRERKQKKHHTNLKLSQRK